MADERSAFHHDALQLRSSDVVCNNPKIENLGGPISMGYDLFLTLPADVAQDDIEAYFRQRTHYKVDGDATYENADIRCTELYR